MWAGWIRKINSSRVMKFLFCFAGRISFKTFIQHIAKLNSPNYPVPAQWWIFLFVCLFCFVFVFLFVWQDNCLFRPSFPSDILYNWSDICHLGFSPNTQSITIHNLLTNVGHFHLYGPSLNLRESFVVKEKKMEQNDFLFSVLLVIIIK